MTRSLIATLAAGSLAFAAACTQDKPLNELTAPSKAQANNVAKRRIPVPSLDDEFDSLTTRIPGFGGYFIGRDGDTYVYHTSPAQPGLLAALRASLPPKRTARAIHILQGRFDFHQLRTWKDGAADVLNEPGAVYTDADEARNSVTVGISDPSGSARIIARMVALGVPEDAVHIEVVHPGAVHSSLVDNGLTLRTGPEIVIADTSHPTNGGGTCTLGFLAIGMSNSQFASFFIGQNDGIDADKYQDKYYIITNSHCSGKDSSLMGHVFPNTRLYQNGIDGVVAAVKYEDPPFTSGWLGCPSGQKCRVSDAAAYTVVTGNYCPWDSCGGSHYSGYGTAYRTITPWGDSTQAGTQTIDGTNGPWSIVPNGSGTYISVAVGDSILKIGKTSGTTRGFVTGTCLTSNQSRPDGTPLGITIFCDTKADLYDNIGDSGAGVFVRSGSNSLIPVGLSWGGGTNANGSVFHLFATWSNVAYDLQRIGHRLTAAPDSYYALY